MSKRFTPTRVGNTAGRCCCCRASAVHPHTRGEYTVPRSLLVRLLGSPPHAWGILQRPAGVFYSARFTPTRVGNTPPVKAGPRVMPVHPHTRGEYVGRTFFAHRF